MSAWRCRAYAALLVDCADGALDPRQQEHLDQHLAGCAACRRDLAALREVPALLQTSAMPDPGEAFWSQQREAIGRAVRSRPSPRSGWRLDWVRDALRLHRLRYSVAMAASLAVAVLVYWLADEAPLHPGRPAAQVATLDVEAMVSLDDLVQALAPADEDPLRSTLNSDLTLAALPVDELIGGSEHAAADAPHVTDLTDSELDGVNELVGGVG